MTLKFNLPPRFCADHGDDMRAAVEAGQVDFTVIVYGPLEELGDDCANIPFHHIPMRCVDRDGTKVVEPASREAAQLVQQRELDLDDLYEVQPDGTVTDKVFPE